MIQSNSQQITYLPQPPNLTIFPTNICATRINLPALEPIQLLSGNPNYPFSSRPQESTLNSSSFSNNSTSDETEEPQLGILDERRQRRMISNRESARRSRMRKQRQLDELWSQVLRLRTENHNLIEKLNEACESHDRALQENVRLEEEATDLRAKLMDLQVSNAYSIFKDLDELSCNNTHLDQESSDHSMTTSQDLLH